MFHLKNNNGELFCRDCKKFKPTETFRTKYYKYVDSTLLSTRTHRACSKCRSKSLKEAQQRLAETEERLLHKGDPIEQLTQLSIKLGMIWARAIKARKFKDKGKEAFFWRKHSEIRRLVLEKKAAVRLMLKDQASSGNPDSSTFDQLTQSRNHPSVYE